MARPFDRLAATGGHRTVDRAAMIEAASRSLRQQQMVRTRDRPISKGAASEPRGLPFRCGQDLSQIPDFLGGTSESSQRRNRSAENQSRITSKGRPLAGVDDALLLDSSNCTSAACASPFAPVGLYSSCSGATLCLGAAYTDPYSQVDLNFQPDDEAYGSEDMTYAFGLSGDPAPEPGISSEELKRPLSRKKGPSASAAAGLGAYSGPERGVDAFEQRKTRQPIPLESWGPRPPSRHGLLSKAGLDNSFEVEKVKSPAYRQGPGVDSAACGLSIGSRPNSRAGADPLKVVGGTWAASRALLGDASSVVRWGRNGRPLKQGTGEDLFADVGTFPRATRSPSQQMAKSLSGAFDINHSNVVGVAEAARPATVGQFSGAASLGPWPSTPEGVGVELQDDKAQEAVMGPWPSSHSTSSASGSMTSPMRRARTFGDQATTLEDFEVDADGPLTISGTALRSGPLSASSPQVIVTRASPASRGRIEPSRRRDGPKRGSEARGAPREDGSSGGRSALPFSTNLDVDFLSLFAT